MSKYRFEIICFSGMAIGYLSATAIVQILRAMYQ